jgi:hypothetical protein
MIKWSFILLVLAFWSCHNKSGPTKVDSPSRYLGYYKIEGDSLVIPPFEIGISLSPKAEIKLKKDKETIIVAAYFCGVPKDTTSEEYMQDGDIFVASDKIELTDARTAKFQGVKFSKSLYDSLRDKDIKLSVNIYSGRKSSLDNLLDGGLLSNKMSRVKGKSYSMKVKLIYNDD